MLVLFHWSGNGCSVSTEPSGLEALGKFGKGSSVEKRASAKKIVRRGEYNLEL